MIHDRKLVALLTAEVVSGLGTQMTWLALPWFVLVETGSATRMGTVYAAELLPMAVLGIPMGTLVQRLGGRTTMLACDLARAPLLALVPILHAAGVLSFPLLLVLVALMGVFATPYWSSQRLILAEVIGQDTALLGQANTLVEGFQRISTLVGPALAGVLIGAFGATNVLWLDAASYLFSFVVVLLFVTTRAETPKEEGAASGWFAALRYVRSDRLLVRGAIASFTFGFLFPLLFASFPVLAYERYDQNPRVAGALFAAWGAGSVLGAIVAYRLIVRVPPMRLAGVGGLLTALPLWLLVPDVPVWAIGLVLIVSAGAIPAINAPYIALLQTRVPPGLRAQVMQSLVTVNTLLAPLGFALAGPLLAWLGVRGVYVVVAALATFAALVFLDGTRGEAAAAVAQEAA
jgi:predicted MFS family arabinose efflux permease